MFLLRNASLVGFLGTAFLGLVAASGQVHAATPVALDETNLELLRGRWEGTLEILDDRLDVKKQTTFVMDIIGKSDLKTSIVIDEGKTVEGKVFIKDGKIKIIFMKAPRNFVLERIEDGKLRLSADFDAKKDTSKAGMKLLGHRVVLEKASPQAAVAEVGTPVALDQTNLDLLRGRWQGTFVRRDKGGGVVSSMTATFEISGAISLTNYFVIGEGDTRKSGTKKIVVENGKLDFPIGKQKREFVLERMKDGKHRLSADFDATWRYAEFRHTVMLDWTSAEVSVAAAAAIADADAANAVVDPGMVIALDEGTMSLLYGRWEGTLNRGGGSGGEITISLDVVPGSPPQGNFSNSKGNRWSQLIRIESGKLNVGIDKGKRDFTLERGGDGRLRLKAAYERSIKGRSRETTIVLEKTGTGMAMAAAQPEGMGRGVGGPPRVGVPGARPPASPKAPPVAAAPSAPLPAAPQDTAAPVLELPETVSTEKSLVEIAGAVRDESRLVEVTVDGRPVAVSADGSFTVRRGVPQGTSTIVVAALDEWGNQAERSITVTRRAPANRSVALTPETPAVEKKPSLFADVHFGKYYALIIGNNEYTYLPDLKTAVGDAMAVAKLLEADYGFETTVLKNATRGDVIGALARLRATLKPDDNLLVYYAGHGIVDPITEEGYWLPVDAEEAIPTNWVSVDDITNMLQAIRSKHVMVVADSCYSGTLVRAAPAKMKTAAERVAWIKRMLAKRSRTALVSGGLEPVMDSGGEGHSVFASAFLEALGENQDVLDGQALFDAIKRPVVLNADQTPQYSDIRHAGHEGGEFVFVRR